VKVFRNKGHFNQGAGILEFPEILEEFPLSSNTGWIPVSEKDLPLELPKVKHYEPSGTGESPLANIDKWVNTKCPVCGGPAKRETNTMPQWAGSCWYYLAYVMQGISNFQFPISNYRKAFEYWNPVDIYVGGAEHATRHLIYARFWHKFLYDIGAVNNVEPFTRLQNVGLILAEDGRKMSKRWGNVINPDDVVREYGADSMRLYEMFMGPFDQPCAWSMQGLVGMRRFLEKIWNLKASVIARRPKADEAIQEANGSPRRFAPRDDVTTLLHQTIKKVTDDIEAMRFNTAIASLMTLVNEMSKSENLQLTTYNLLLQLLSPFAPHITEELWSQLGNKDSITKAEWPKYDPELAKSEEMTIAVQVNGKLRDTITMSADASEETVKSEALKSEKVQKWLEGKEPKKVIYVRGKLVSVVV
jgi:leucyl-tRNA synthetase